MKLDASKLVKSSYAEYGSHVNSSRALPDARDGLKPVQRRIIMAAVKEGALSKTVKSATVVGTTLGRYHPHSESAVYDTLVRMVNHQVPLFDKQGNFGLRSYTSAPPAAMRYTGVKLKGVADNLFLKYKEFVPYFENELHWQEPEVSSYSDSL